MDWVLIALIIGSVFYACKSVMEYSSQSSDFELRIEDLDRKSKKLAEAAESEASVTSEVRTRVGALKSVTEELRGQLSTAKSEVQTEADRSRRLLLAENKHRLKKSRKVGVA